MRQVLFLSGGENTFYDECRNAYPGVRARRLFRHNSTGFRALRRAVHGLHPPWISWYFGDWVRELGAVDLIILPVSLYSPAVLRFLRRRTSAPIVNWYWNPVDTTELPGRLRVENSRTLSFDEDDCRRHGLDFMSTYYFGHIRLQDRPVEHDLCFVGADKGRLPSLLELKRQLHDLGLKPFFHITGRDSARRATDFRYADPMDYPTLLDVVSRSRAILDFVQSGQVGLSQRPMESIFLRRKLVTNDARIAQKDFYDPENVFILGLDDLGHLPAFLHRPFRDVEPTILARYDFGNWVARVLALAPIDRGRR